MIWKKISDRYEVSSCGQIRAFSLLNGLSSETPRFIKQRKQKDGYLQAKVNGNVQLIHRVVARAFIPNPENKDEVNHINGIKTDNRVVNLEWVSHAENMSHAAHSGLMSGMQGENNPNCKLTKDCVLKIFNDKRSARVIANEYGVSGGTVWKIKQKRIWTHVLKKL